MSSSEAVRCSGLVRRFGERDALAGLDLAVADGEVVLLTGPNGAGKTTLLRVLATVLRPSAGSASLYGHELPGQAAPARRLVGYAGHEPLLYPLLTAAENLRLYSALHGSDGAEVESALEGVGMARRAGDRVEELSRGMRQRLSLARAMLHGPRLLLLDEPTSGLDDEGRGVLLTLLEQPGRTAVVATHEPDWFAGVAGRAVAIDRGRVAV
jgi:heme ABC exporter ATP-binding subunit CcmA